jgi:hypothetical protein
MSINQLTQIANAVWEHAAEFPFSPSDVSPKPFSVLWMREHYAEMPEFCDNSRKLPKQSGWYWIATDIPVRTLCKTKTNVREKGAHDPEGRQYKSIGKTASDNIESIGPHISTETRNGRIVVYNAGSGVRSLFLPQR